MDDLSTIASIADAALSFALLAGLVIMFIKGTLVPKTAHERVIANFEGRLVEKDRQCQIRMDEKDEHCADMSRVHAEQLVVIINQGDQRVGSLTEIMQEREKRYAAVIAALEASSNLESDIATLVRTLKMGGVSND